jgi:pSer/pThr/pTyr-binding forkhead associated (FHA) protein
VVSKFHAFFKEEDGKLLLQDADSRNGTRVDDQPVARKKASKGTVVGPGMKIGFGLLDFWLLDAAGLRDLARQSYPAP